MSDKNNITETELQAEKVVTRYDRRMQKRREQEAKEKKEKKIATVIGILAAVIIVGVIAFFPIRDAIARNQTFVEVGGEKVTRVEFDYYYGTSVNSYYSQYGSYMSMMGVDLSKDLSTQTYSGDLTWEDFFQEMAVNSIKQDRAALKAAKEAGFKYDATEDWKVYKESLEAEAEANGVTANQMAQYSFGSHITVGRLEKLVKNSMMVRAYLDQVKEDNLPDEDKILDIYENNKESYDSVDYRFVQVDAVLPTEPTELADKDEKDSEESEDDEYEPSEAEIEAAMAEAKKAADDAVKTVAKSGEQVEDATWAYVNSLYAEWLFDEERKAGDTTVIEDETNHRYYVLAFEKRYLMDHPTADVYIINVDNGNGESVLNAWKNGEATVESFIELFNQYDGYAYGPANGFYQGISARDLLGEVGEWVFAEERAEGDTTYISVEEDGDYVMYFAGKGDVDWKEAIRAEYAETYMINYISELIVDVEVSDPKGNLHYLKVQQAQAEADATAGTEETEGTEATAE